MSVCVHFTAASNMMWVPRRLSVGRTAEQTLRCLWPYQAVPPALTFDNASLRQHLSECS